MEDFRGQVMALQQRILKALEQVNIPEKREKLEQLEKEMGVEGFWESPKEAGKVAERAGKLRQSITEWGSMHEDINGILELMDGASEEDIILLQESFKKVEDIFNRTEVELLFSTEHDEKPAIVTIQVGNGGQDAEDFSAMVERMILRFSEEQGMTAEILEESHTDVGLRSATLRLGGEHAYGKLRAIHGVHRLIRLSPFNAKSLRQTSFTRVDVLPEMPEDQFEMDEKDLRVDVFRSSGPGGQSVNTTDSAVRITYLPLGLTVTCQNEKSQQQNKLSAMRVLVSKLEQIRAREQAENLQELRGKVMENSFGSQVITYTLQPYQMVKDHRTDYESSQPQKVLDGDLWPLCERFLRL